MENARKLTGRVKFFNKEKGWGFVNAETDDYFVHFTQIDCMGFRTLEENEIVEFEVGEGKNGKKEAKSVKRLNEVIVD